MEHTIHDEENNIQNYQGKEAIEKLKELAESARICMFTTFAVTRPLASRPMALQSVDEDGTMYFFSSISSNKNAEIQAIPHVQLFFSNNNSSEYLSVYGSASISQDREKIKELWSMWAKAWFQDGPDDPTLSLIKVKPEDVHYWDTKHNKMVQLVKIAASIISGKVMDDSVEGKLEI